MKLLYNNIMVVVYFSLFGGFKLIKLYTIIDSYLLYNIILLWWWFIFHFNTRLIIKRKVNYYFQ